MLNNNDSVRRAITDAQRAVLEEGDGGVAERMCLCSLRMNRSFPYGLDISGKYNIYAKAY